MPRLRYPDVSVRVAFLAGFALANLMLLTGTWELAYLAGFLAGMLCSRVRRAVLIGALSVAVAWAAYLSYVFVLGQGLQLADLVGQILGVGAGAWWLLTLLTLVLGALLGAAGGLTGYTGSRLFVWEESAPVVEAPKS